MSFVTKNVSFIAILKKPEILWYYSKRKEVKHMISINRGSATDASDSIKRQSRAVINKSDEISMAARDLFGMTGMASVIASLSKIERKLCDDGKKLYRMGTALDRIVEQYMTTENRIEDNADGSLVNVPKPSIFEWVIPWLLPPMPTGLVIFIPKITEVSMDMLGGGLK